MSDGEMFSLICRAVERIRREGGFFGKVELIVRDGVVKHVNVSYEVLPDPMRNSECGMMQRSSAGFGDGSGDSPMKGQSPEPSLLPSRDRSPGFGV